MVSVAFSTVMLRLGVALLLGALVGLERESNEHSAGLRTNALVSLGCAMFTIISAYGFSGLLGENHVQVDPTRIASYVVAGIGFLGAGAIFRLQDKEKVKGLTTAAAIWVVAAIGMACGAGMLWEAVALTVLALVVLIGLRFAEPLLVLTRASSIHHIEIEVDEAEATHLMKNLYDLCTRHEASMESVTVRKKDGIEAIKFMCKVQGKASIPRLLDDLRTQAGVQMVDVDVKGSQIGDT
jgi:putative Mg2+ transporter-C (MgtC) family protein